MSVVCQNCKKRPATVNFIETVGGETVALHLCEQCYKYKYGEFESTAMGAMLNGLFGEPEQPVKKVCKVCGMRFEDYERTGLLGCAGCYEAFRAPLTETVRSLHGSILHRGKRPVRLGAEERYDRLMADTARRAALREEMEQAMREHDYARAGELRRLLKAMASAGEER